MQYRIAALALLASTVAALPQIPPPDTECYTSTICTDAYPTSVQVVTDLITSTSVSSHFSPVVVTTSTPSPVVYPVYVTHTSETTSTWEVTSQVKVPYVTHRVVTIPVHTYSLSEECVTSSTELYPINVVTTNATSTTYVQHLVTSSSACSETFYPVSTSLRTNIITSTVQSCYTVTAGHGGTSTLTGPSLLTGVTLSTPTTTSLLTGVTLSTPTTTSLLTGVTLSSPTTTSTTTILTGVTLSSPTTTTTVV